MSLKCIYCKEIKDQSLFYNDKSKPSGKKPRCKPCDKLSVDKASRAAYEVRYRAENIDKKRKHVRDSMMRRKEKIKEARREYLKTPSGMASYKKYTQKRYAIKKSAFVENVDIYEKYIGQHGKCFHCGASIDFSDIHADHYIPLSKGGKHCNDNVVISCAPCNLSKGAKMPSEVRHQMV